MASKAELWSQLSYVVKILDEIFKFGVANTPNFLTMQDTLTQALEGSHVPNTTASVNQLRSTLSGMAGSPSALNSIILELAKVGYNSRATGVNAALEDIWTGMVAASETVKSRAWTYGAATPYASNVGTGILYRLTKEDNDNIIEVGAYSGGVVKLLINKDKNNGATSGTESGIIFGVGQMSVDSLEVGTAPNGSTAFSAIRPQDGKLTNPSFTTYSGTGATLAFTGWTLTDATKAAVNLTTYFREEPSSAASVALEFTDNNSIVQYLDDSASKITDSSIPVFLIVRYRRLTSCDGTLTIGLGSQTEAVTLSTVADDTWLDLAIALDKKTYYENFKENPTGKGAGIKATLASRTTGTLLLDDIILASPRQFDGKWYLVTSGQTDFMAGDYFTCTDSVTNTGRIQTTLARLLNFSLPHTDGTPTYADA